MTQWNYKLDIQNIHTKRREQTPVFNVFIDMGCDRWRWHRQYRRPIFILHRDATVALRARRCKLMRRALLVNLRAHLTVAFDNNVTPADVCCCSCVWYLRGPTACIECHICTTCLTLGVLRKPSNPSTTSCAIVRLIVSIIIVITMHKRWHVRMSTIWNCTQYNTAGSGYDGLWCVLPYFLNFF